LQSSKSDETRTFRQELCANARPDPIRFEVKSIGLLEDLDPAILAEGEDDPVGNLVWVSFVENASTDDDEPLRTRLRSFPNLARAVSSYQ